jgi:hypothetical protein
MPAPRLPVIRTLGGCGGTLVARVIAALPGIVLLSETNPRSAALYSGLLNPVVQIRKWAPSLAASVAEFDEHEIGYPPRFGDMIESLQRSAEERGLTLVIRDFNYGDFVGIPFIWPVPMDLSLDQAVVGRFTLAPILLVRHPADQLASLRRHRAIRPLLTADCFLDAYRAFLLATQGTPLYRYEDLVDNPHAVFPQMCASLGIPWDPVALERFPSVEAVTGYMGRRKEATICAPARSEAATRADEELGHFSSYGELLGELGYRAR